MIKEKVKEKMNLSQSDTKNLKIFALTDLSIDSSSIVFLKGIYLS